MTISRRDLLKGILYSVPSAFGLGALLPAPDTTGDSNLIENPSMELSLDGYKIGESIVDGIVNGIDQCRYDQTSWRAVHRVDDQPWLSAPLTYSDEVTVDGIANGME